MSAVDELWRLIERRYGIAPNNGSRQRFEDQLASTARARHQSEREIVLRAAQDPILLADLVGGLTVKESQFFRHAAHFQLITEAARRWLAVPNRWYSVWSAGCAQGEEPYSVAIALSDALQPWELARVAISATDADRSAIASAERGIYTRWAFRTVSPESLGRHCCQCRDGRYQIASEVRCQVAFRHASLQEHVRIMPQASLDAVLFRNVSIYLTEQANADLYGELARVLRPGGLLLVAPSDARPQLASFRQIASQDATVFERSDAAQTSFDALHAPIPPPPALASSRDSVTCDHAPHARIPPPPALASSANVPPQNWGPIDEVGEHGDLGGAMAAIAERLAAGDAPAPAYTRRGKLHLAAGNASAAVEDFRRALYLDPRSNAVRYWYALALRQAGRSAQARDQLGLIVEDPEMPDATLRASALALMGALE